MWSKFGFNHHRQPHVSLESGGMADALTYARHKTKNALITKQQ
jgi:hypothetical protein